MKNRNGIFVTATDTGVGKTYFSCKLAQALLKLDINFGVMKPLSSGDRSDAKKLLKASKLKDSLDLVNPLFFKYPLAPYASLGLEKRKLNIKKVFSSYSMLNTNNKFMIVEGIGGVNVPISRKYFVTDLIKDLRLPAVIVARVSLGTINHTLLTVKELRKKNIPVLAVVLTDSKGKSLSELTNPKILSRLLDTKVYELKRNEDISQGFAKWLLKKAMRS
jgi:dethiobiotin synthetase